MSDLLGLSRDGSSGDDGGDVGPDDEMRALEPKVKSGSNWFYWIAALSLINAVTFAYGSDLSFITALGFTQLVDGLIAASIEDGMDESLRYVSIGFSAVFIIMFALLGYYASRFVFAAFAVGIVIYLLDTLLVLALGAYLMAGFHVFALVFIVYGAGLCRRYNKLEKLAAAPTVQ